MMVDKGMGFALLAAALLAGCGASEFRPVDIYPEDMCAHCRMAVTDQRFACEIITGDHEVFKFDDIACMEAFRIGHPETAVAAAFVKGFDSKTWISLDRARVMQTGVSTPMGSGLVAFADSLTAAAFAAEHPVATVASDRARGGCCGEER
jgi:copper chaperone NosL